MLFFTKFDKIFHFGIVLLLFGLGLSHWMCRLFDQDEAIKCHLPHTSSKNFRDYVKARLKTFDFDLYPASHNFLYYYNTVDRQTVSSFQRNTTSLIRHFKGFEFLSTILFISGIMWYACLHVADTMSRLFKMNAIVNYLDKINRNDQDYRHCKTKLYRATTWDIVLAALGILLPRLTCFVGYILLIYILSNFTQTFWGINYKNFLGAILSADWWPSRYTGKLSTNGAIGHTKGLIEDPLPFNVIAGMKLRVKDQSKFYSFECATKNTNVVMYGKNIIYTVWSAVILFCFSMGFNILMEISRLGISMIKSLPCCDGNDPAFRLPFAARVVMHLGGHSTRVQPELEEKPPMNQNNLLGLEHI